MAVSELVQKGGTCGAKLMEVGLVQDPVHVENPNPLPSHVEGLVFGGNFVLGLGLEFQGHNGRG